MKNRLIKKALCVALASTMVFGEALPALAADGSADVQSAQAEVAFAEEASITYFSVGGQDTVSSGSVHISAAGYGTEAVLYVMEHGMTRGQAVTMTEAGMWIRNSEELPVRHISLSW